MNVDLKLKEWWNERQTEYSKTGNSRYIDHPGTDFVWDFLQIRNRLTKDVKILNIGVGMGIYIKELFLKEIEVHVLDISSLALDRVKSYTKKQYLLTDIENLPVNYFDLIIHHLVAQHSSDEFLRAHLKYGIKSLKRDGIFAMQFADAKGKAKLNLDKDNKGFFSQTTGGCIRTFREMQDFINEAKGKITDVVGFKKVPPGVTWLAIHIMRDD